MRWTCCEIRCLVSAKRTGWPDGKILWSGVLPHENTRTEASVRSILYRIRRRKKLAHIIFLNGTKEAGIGDRTAGKMYREILSLLADEENNERIFQDINSKFWIKKEDILRNLIQKMRKILTYNGVIVVY